MKRIFGNIFYRGFEADLSFIKEDQDAIRLSSSHSPVFIVENEECLRFFYLDNHIGFDKEHFLDIFLLSSDFLRTKRVWLK
jgi:hypothetical protein